MAVLPVSLLNIYFISLWQRQRLMRRRVNGILQGPHQELLPLIVQDCSDTGLLSHIKRTVIHNKCNNARSSSSFTQYSLNSIQAVHTTHPSAMNSCLWAPKTNQSSYDGTFVKHFLVFYCKCPVTSVWHMQIKVIRQVEEHFLFYLLLGFS